jgi:hypothetical protein
MKRESILTTKSVSKVLIPVLKITVLEIKDHTKMPQLLSLCFHTPCNSDCGLSLVLKNSRSVTNELVSIFYFCFASVTSLSAVAYIIVLRKTYK